MNILLMSCKCGRQFESKQIKIGSSRWDKPILELLGRFELPDACCFAASIRCMD